MNEVGKFRLLALRIFYFLTGVSFGSLASVNIFSGDGLSDGLQSLIRAVFFAFALLSITGILQPLRMLPLLLFSLAWKSIWIITFVIPMYLGVGLDGHSQHILFPVFSGLLVTLVVIPWKYTVNNYFSLKVNR